MKKLVLLFLVLLSPAAWADCTVAAFSRGQADAGGGLLQIAQWPPLSEQTVTVSGTAAEPAAAFPSGTQLLYFKCTGKTHFTVGPLATVEATTDSVWVEAGEGHYIGLPAITFMISFIEGS
jgi:hypothetical protein